MPQELKLLTTEDVAALQKLLDTLRTSPTVAPGRPRERTHGDSEGQASDVHLARTPLDGIPGNEENTTGTGKIGSTGTGSDVLRDDEPGYAECDCYRIDEGFTPPRIVPIDGLSKRVYNISTTAIEGDIWVIISKLKGGRWVAVIPTSGSGGSGGSTGESKLTEVVVDVSCSGGNLVVTKEFVRVLI